MNSKIYISILFSLLFTSLSAQTLEEIAIPSGINYEYIDFGDFGGGGVWFDYDNDGDEDLYAVGGRQVDHLFRNNGDGTFTDVTFGSGIEITADYFTPAVIAGDIDNDGFRDILVSTWFQGTDTNIHEPEILFKNNGDGTFTNISEVAGITSRARAMGAAFIDINNDSYLDIYVINYIEVASSINAGGQVIGFDHECFDNFFYLNNGDGTFTEMAEDLGVADAGCALAIATTDIDHDGDTDMYLANDFGEWIIPNAFFENIEGTDEFEDIGPMNNADIEIYAMGIAIGDYDLDQDLDIYVSNLGRNVLLNNNGEGVFSDVTTEANVENEWGMFPFRATSWGTAFIDYDNDLYEDLFVSNGRIPAADFIATADLDSNKVYHNNGDGTFTDVSLELGFYNVAACRGLTYSDYDQDGDIDVFVVPMEESLVEEEHARLYRNNIENDNNWVQIHLIGVECNRDAIGSQIRLFVDDKVLIREIKGGSSHASMNSLIAHFGLGTNEQIDSILVDWVGGETQTVVGAQINHRYSIKQGVDPFVKVTFELNANLIDVDENGLFVAGGDEFGVPGDNMLLDEDQDGIYTFETILPRNYSGYYIFTNGDCDDFSCAENLIGQDCADPDNFNNRFLDNIQQDTIIEACFGSCDYELCLMNFDSVDITFELNMAPVNVAGSGVFLAGGGTFGVPGDYPMEDPDGDGIYTITVTKAVGFTSYYSFTNGNCPDFTCKEDLTGQECGDPNNFYDRFIENVTQDTVIEACFGSCDYDFCLMNFDSVDITIELNMEYQDVSAEGVFLAGGGNFGEPGEYPMEDPDGDGVYSITIRQPAGFSSHYTFTNGNCPDFTCKENIAGQDCADPTNFNDRFMGPIMSDTLIQTCFSECTTDLMCTPPVEPVMVSFLVNMQNEVVDPTGVYLGADFDGWSGDIALTDDNEDGIWQVDIPLEPGTYEYKFINGGPSFAGEVEELTPEDHAECTLTTGMFTNRIVTIMEGENTMVLDSVCFGSCEACIVNNIPQVENDWDVNIQPTISKDRFIISFKEDHFEEKQIRVFNTSGQLIQENYIDQPSFIFRLDAMEWPAGLYFVKIQRGNDWQSKTFKVIKQ
jgi:hypothetical protein